MNKKVIFGVIGVCAVILVGFLLFRVLVSHTVQTPEPVATNDSTTTVRKIDLSTQPEWVQKLVVTATGGRSANSLKNVTIAADGLPAGEIDSIDYVIQYETTNRGAQGALSSKPIAVDGGTKFSKTIDLGTCSTKTCVNHDGVTLVDIELNFNASSGDQFSWSGTLPIN